MIKFQPKLSFGRVVVFAVVLVLFGFVNKAEDPIDRLVAALRKWTATSPQEKVYLHFDKPYYALGDTVWFKGYVTTGSRHQLSAISSALYVDLINEQDSVVKDLKLPVTTGMAMGDIILGDDLTEGNYRIRAYTQWMRNAGDEYYFDKTFTVGSVASNGIITKAGYQYKDIESKQQLSATLNYTDDQGLPLVNKNILSRIVIGHQVVFTKSGKTDANGNLLITVTNKDKIDLTGAYIRTVLNNSSNKEIIKDFPIKAALSQSDVQFFPEGGDLVTDVASRIGFKAIGVDGLGIDLSAKIIEAETNRTVTSFTVSHAGMGNFILRPEAGHSYIAQLTFDDQSVKNIALPKAKEDGYVLSVYQPKKDSILVRINTSGKQTGQVVGLLAQSGGETVFASNLSINRPITSVWLDKSAFPSGIAQFTLFDAAGEAVNQRIAFIKSNDRLNLTIKPGKGSYKSKEQVLMNLVAKDADGRSTAGNYSVSVIDESKIPSNEANETSIFSALLLTSDIKGYVEKPNYYFVNDTEETDQALDNLMLTQGYRRFVWKDILQNAPTKPVFAAEPTGITISGKVLSLSDKPAPNATVTLLSTRARITKFATSDADGRFSFDGIFLTDSIKFAVQARTKNNSDKLKVILDSVPRQKMTRNPNLGDLSTNIPGTLRAYIEAGKKQDEVNIKMGKMDKVHKLREVSIKGSKDKKDPVAFQWDRRIPEGHADRTINVKEAEMENAGSLGMYLAKGGTPNMKVIPFRGVPTAKVMGVEMDFRVILNGRLLNSEEAFGVFDNSFVEGTDIVKMEVVISSATQKAILGTGDSPVLLIYTKPPQDRKQFNPSLANIIPKGFNKAREFYSPKYAFEGPAMKIPDMRGTIYWNPYLKTYAAGQGNFSFYCADGPATYRVTVEGLNADGQLGRQVLRFTVDGDLVNGIAPEVLPGRRALAVKK